MEGNDVPLQLQLDQRQIAQVLHARYYAAHFADAGAPGHGQFLLIAKLAMLLDHERERTTPRTVQKVMWDADAQCHRDVMTGVKVDL